MTLNTNILFALEDVLSLFAYRLTNVLFAATLHGTKDTARSSSLLQAQRLHARLSIPSQAADVYLLYRTASSPPSLSGIVSNRMC